MTSVLDVSTLTVTEQGADSEFVPAEVILTNSMLTESIELTVESIVDTVEVVTAGMQGRPGLQNVFVDATDPSDESWGEAQKNFIWVKI